MVDMVFVTKNDLSLNVYYNKLLNQQQIMQQKGSTTSRETTAFGLKKLCAETNRAVNRVKDIFAPFSQSAEEKNVVKHLLSSDPNAIDL